MAPKELRQRTGQKKKQNKTKKKNRSKEPQGYRDKEQTTTNHVIMVSSKNYRWFRRQISDDICLLLFFFILTNYRVERRLCVKWKEWMSNSIDPDETAIIIACGSERVNGSFLALWTPCWGRGRWVAMFFVGLWLVRHSRLSSSSWAAVWNHEYAIQSKRICTTTFSVITVKGHAILVIVHYASKSVFEITVKLRG